MLSYSADVDSKTAYEALKTQALAALIDVRTATEWHYVGIPDLRSIGKSLVMIELRTMPGMNLNPNFIDELEENLPNKDAPLYFLCRTGGRSQEAAALAIKNGYAAAYNVIYGFEGELNNYSHRGEVNGWKAANLPWRQS